MAVLGDPRAGAPPIHRFESRHGSESSWSTCSADDTGPNPAGMSCDMATSHSTAPPPVPQSGGLRGARSGRGQGERAE